MKEFKKKKVEMEMNSEKKREENDAFELRVRAVFNS